MLGPLSYPRQRGNIGRFVMQMMMREMIMDVIHNKDKEGGECECGGGVGVLLLEVFSSSVLTITIIQ